MLLAKLSVENTKCIADELPALVRKSQEEGGHLSVQGGAAVSVGV